MHGINTHIAKEHHLDRVTRQTYVYLRKYFAPEQAEEMWMAGQRISDLNERALFYTGVVLESERRIHNNPVSAAINFQDYAKWQRTPVDVEEFVCSDFYLDKKKELYPAVLRELKEINNGNYVELVATGGIGSGKTTIALYTNAYQLYLLSCMRAPHQLFNLDPASEILLIFQSKTEKLAKGVDFNRFKSMIETSPYFRKFYPYQKKIESKLVFPNRIEVHPVSGMETAAIGQNVIGGLIDELNYMDVVTTSKQSVDQGTYDQAVALYNSIARRRKSRFMEQGKLPGILCLVSSKRYPGQFTDIKEQEAQSDPTIYIYDKRVWEIKPDAFTGYTFKVFVGDLTRKPRILDVGESLGKDDVELVRSIPVEFQKEFETDITNALREIAGVSTLARHPFFLEVGKVDASFQKRPSIFSSNTVDFVDSKLVLLKGALHKPELPRFVHVDLAISGDSAGLAIGCVTGFTNMKQIRGGDEEGMMPSVYIDGILEVKPPKNSEIQFYKIREILIQLRDKMGLNIRWVTFDTFQSTDSLQLLRQQGFITGTQSMDVVPCRPYDTLKNAVYDGRLNAPMNNHTQREILMLERDARTQKIDHPPNGSKDTADALAGVVHGLTMRREIWGMFGIPIVQIPSSVMNAADKLSEKNQKGVDTQHAAG